MLWWTFRQLRSKNERSRSQARERLRADLARREGLARSNALLAIEKEMKSSVSQRREAVLEFLRTPETREMLADMLGDNSDTGWYSNKARDLLSEVCSAELVPALVRLLDSRDWKTDDEAILNVLLVLGEVVDQRAVPSLVAAVLKAPSSGDLVTLVIGLLDKVGDEEAFRSLGSVFQSAANVEKKRAVATALAKIGDRRVLSPLVLAFNHGDKETKASVAETLQKLGWEPATDEEKARFAVLGKNWKAAIAAGPAAMPLLGKVLRSGAEPAVLMGAALALGKIGHMDGVPPLRQVITHLETFVLRLLEVVETSANSSMTTEEMLGWFTSASDEQKSTSSFWWEAQGAWCRSPGWLPIPDAPTSLTAAALKDVFDLAALAVAGCAEAVRQIAEANASKDLDPRAKEDMQATQELAAGVLTKLGKGHIRFIELIRAKAAELGIGSAGNVAVVDLVSAEEKQIAEDARAGVSLGAETDALVQELIKIGREPGFVGECPDAFDEQRRHKRAREIGAMLHEQGGMALMQAAAYRVKNSLGSARSLEVCWDKIGAWRA